MGGSQAIRRWPNPNPNPKINRSATLHLASWKVEPQNVREVYTLPSWCDTDAVFRPGRKLFFSCCKRMKMEDGGAKINTGLVILHLTHALYTSTILPCQQLRWCSRLSHMINTHEVRRSKLLWSNNTFNIFVKFFLFYLA